MHYIHLKHFFIVLQKKFKNFYSPATAVAAAGCLPPAAGKTPAVCGRPDNVSLSCKPNSSRT